MNNIKDVILKARQAHVAEVNKQSLYRKINITQLQENHVEKKQILQFGNKSDKLATTDAPSKQGFQQTEKTGISGLSSIMGKPIKKDSSFSDLTLQSKELDK